MKELHIDFKILWTKLLALFMSCVLLLPAQQVISYCYPMERVMIVDCCAEEAKHHHAEHVDAQSLKNRVCCSDLSLGEPDTRQMIDSPELLDGFLGDVAWLKTTLEPEQIIEINKVNFVQPLSFLPLARGPPPYLRNRALLL